MQHIRYKPRINLGSLGVTRKEASIDYATRYAKITPTLTPTETYVQPLQPPPVISVPISPPPSFYEQSYGIAPTLVSGEPFVATPTPIPVFDPTPLIRPDFIAPGAEPFVPAFDTAIPEQFRYSKEQLMDMLARGASETFERTGETDSGLPLELELEQISRELDATKQFVVDADGTIIPVEPETAPGAGLAWIAAAIAGFFILGG